MTDAIGNVTEQRNDQSENLDGMSARQLVDLMVSQDALVHQSVANEAAEIATAITWVADAIRSGGRLVYIGAGTSGRLGVLDASECPPTFSSDPSQVVGIIAGGPNALTTAIEGAEDDPDQAAEDLKTIQFGRKDILFGIATSGRTPYVIGALKCAKSLGSKTIGFTCNKNTPIHDHSDLTIAPVVGPEILSGSTRLKSGTATKMVLNQVTTGAMVLLGKTFGNLMVDLRASNQKLKSRSARILTQIAGIDSGTAEVELQRCDGELKTAIVAVVKDCDPLSAREKLNRAEGHLRSALES